MTGTATPAGSKARRTMFLVAAREAVGMPSIVLGASYVGFGSLVRESGMGLWLGLFSTLSAWALPGQVALVELYGVGASLLVIALAVALTNARLMPMTITLMPLIHDPAVPRWRYYLYSHLVAVTAWAFSMRRCPEMPRDVRLPYFVGFATVLWLASLIGTAVGFALADAVPQSVTLGLVFLNPIYFMLIFATDLRHRARVIALGLGAVMGPTLHTFSHDWGLMLTGLIAGSAAFGADRLVARRRG
ncbi:AzlC family ABC transporter permease [Skermanella rosea]|uniref:AzlC family ABC transporter permease n=1 Tax=Skermanella rosea TaxID=1817965 RepID=UPI001E63E019|nr:AzlC family ABC transporter permease [Skermanella rosea]UEM06018.1 AzlC family ABC transporter permease [Skermanella rosea]